MQNFQHADAVVLQQPIDISISWKRIEQTVEEHHQQLTKELLH